MHYAKYLHRAGLSVVFALIATQVFSATEKANPSRCHLAGGWMLESWHHLDKCLQHQALDAVQVNRTRDTFTQTYPKLYQEVFQSSALSHQAKILAHSSPYEYAAPDNKVLIGNMCQSSLDFLGSASTSDDWRKELACWLSSPTRGGGCIFRFNAMNVPPRRLEQRG